MDVSHWLQRVAPAALVGLMLAAPALAGPVSLTDLDGRTVELPGPASRVVAYPVPSASVVIALDGGIDRLVALHPEAKTAIEDGILGDFFPMAKELPDNILAGGAKKGRTPDIAGLKALNPDLVIQWDHAGPDAQAIIDTGIPTALLRFGDEQYIRDAIKMIGTGIGKPDKVDMLMKWRDDTEHAIAGGLAGMPEQKKVKIAYFFYAKTDLQTEGDGTYFDWQISLVGGINAAAAMDGWGKVTDEQVEAWNPDIILLGTFERGLDLSRVLADTQLSQTSAARNKRVYMMPLGGYRWEPASVESPFTWMWLANIAYPDRFHFDLRAEVKKWYPKLYGHTPTEAQIDRILQMKMNGGEANYAMFGAK